MKESSLRFKRAPENDLSRFLQKKGVLRKKINTQSKIKLNRLPENQLELLKTLSTTLVAKSINQVVNKPSKVIVNKNKNPISLQNEHNQSYDKNLSQKAIKTFKIQNKFNSSFSTKISQSQKLNFQQDSEQINTNTSVDLRPFFQYKASQINQEDLRFRQYPNIYPSSDLQLPNLSSSFQSSQNSPGIYKLNNSAINLNTYYVKKEDKAKFSIYSPDKILGSFKNQHSGDTPHSQLSRKKLDSIPPMKFSLYAIKQIRKQKLKKIQDALQMQDKLASQKEKASKPKNIVQHKGNVKHQQENDPKENKLKLQKEDKLSPPIIFLNAETTDTSNSPFSTKLSQLLNMKTKIHNPLIYQQDQSKSPQRKEIISSGSESKQISLVTKLKRQLKKANIQNGSIGSIQPQHSQKYGNQNSINTLSSLDLTFNTKSNQNLSQDLTENSFIQESKDQSQLRNKVNNSFKKQRSKSQNGEFKEEKQESMLENSVEQIKGFLQQSNQLFESDSNIPGKIIIQESQDKLRLKREEEKRNTSKNNQSNRDDQFWQLDISSESDSSDSFRNSRAVNISRKIEQQQKQKSSKDSKNLNKTITQIPKDFKELCQLYNQVFKDKLTQNQESTQNLNQGQQSQNFLFSKKKSQSVNESQQKGQAKKEENDVNKEKQQNLNANI